MENINIIFLSNKEADLAFFKMLPHLKEYSVKIDTIDRCYLLDNFVFAEVSGNYRFYDELLENDEVTVKMKAWNVIDTVRKNVFSTGYEKVVLAVHWGEKDKTDLKLFLKKLNDTNNEKNDVIFSYWGSRSETYKNANLELIKAEIIDWANDSAENELNELLETIEIHIKAIGRYNGKQIEAGRENDVRDEIDKILKKLTYLKAKMKV